VYIVVSRYQKEGQNHSLLTANETLGNVATLKYLGTIVINQNSIHKEMKIRLNSGNDCYHSAWRRLSPSLLSKNYKIKIPQNHNFTCCFVWVWNMVSH